MRTLFTIIILSLSISLISAQTITFTTSCETINFCSYEPDCGPAFAELIAEATTTCPSGNLSYSYSIDLGNDGSTDQNGSVADASGNFPLGEHKVIFTASDDCNNTEICEVVFTMEDCVAPVLSTFNGFAFDLQVDGTFELPANSFDNGSSDNCGITSWLINSPSLGPGQTEPSLSASTSVVFTCGDIGTQTVDLWVSDASGNWSTLPNYVVVQDNLNNCSSSPTFELCLYAETECGEAIANVDYGIPPLPGIPDLFPCWQYPDGWVTAIAPVKNTDPLNGVSTFDIVLIYWNILQVQLLDSPYKLIAADVNNSGGISALDLVHMRQLILAQISEFPNNTSWRFVDKDFIFPNSLNPWATSFPEICTINSFDEDITKTFIGVKVGDVSSNTLPCDSLWSPDSDDRSLETLTFKLEDLTFETNQVIRIPFKAHSFKNILGYQFELYIDPEALEFKGLEKGDLQYLDETNFGLNQVREGKIKTSWINLNTESTDFSGQELFYLNFKTLKTGQISDYIKIAENGLNPESYNDDLETMDIHLEFNATQSIQSLGLLQNHPNPFKTQTSIEFYSLKSEIVSLRIYALNGKMIQSIQQEAIQGPIEIYLKFDSLTPPGVYYYQLQTSIGVFTGKMIKA